MVVIQIEFCSTVYYYDTTAIATTTTTTTTTSLKLYTTTLQLVRILYTTLPVRKAVATARISRRGSRGLLIYGSGCHDC